MLMPLGRSFDPRKLIAAGLAIIGLALVLIGYEDLIGATKTFYQVGCTTRPVPPNFCIRVYTWDMLAILTGAVAVLTGISMLLRVRSCSKQ